MHQALIRTILITLSLFSFSSYAQNLIGVNFLGRNGGDTTLTAAETAGILPQANWNNLPSDTPGFDGSQFALTHSGGGITGVTMEWDASDSWNSLGDTTTADRKLFKGIQKANPNPDTDTGASSMMHFRWQNLLPGSTYNVLVYQAHNGGGAKAQTEINGTTYYSENQPAYADTFIQATNTVAGTYPIANYVRFDNVSPDGSGTIEIEVRKLIETPQLTDGIGVAGLQLELVSGSWPTIKTPVILQEPEDFLGVVGQNANFSIQTDGPWTIGWYTNGVLVTSGLATDFTLATSAADKDSQIHAVVSNPAGMATSAVATLTLDDPTPPEPIQGFLRVEHYGNFGGVIVTNMYMHPAYQSRNFEFEFFNLGAGVPGTQFNDFGRHVEGYVRPDVSGTYNFFTRSDDQSELYINPISGTGAGSIPDDLANRVADATELDCCDAFMEPGTDATTTSGFPLTGGSFYGIAALYKEGGGGDFFELAWRELGDVTAAGQLQPIGPENVFVMGSTAGKRVMITQQPQSLTVSQGTSASFSVTAEAMPASDPTGVQWLRDGAVIPGETGNDYAINNLQLSDNGATLQAKIYSLAGAITSEVATLTVNSDVTGPALTSAGHFEGADLVGLLFDEALEGLSATDPFNYTVAGYTVQLAERVSDGDNVVVLTLDRAITNATTVQASGMSDVFGNENADSGLHPIEGSDLAPLTLGPATDPVLPGRGVYLGQDNFYMEAGGSDIWGTGDHGFVIQTAQSGGFDMIVRVQSLAGPNTWTKSGIMIRESMDIGARNLFQLTTRTGGQNLSSLQWRDATDAVTGDVGALRQPDVPYPNAWLRIVRADGSSNTLQTFFSTDGTTWTSYVEHTIPVPALPSTLLIGMAATSHDNGASAAPAEVLFRDFSITPLSTPPDPIPITVTQLGIGGELDWDNHETWILQTTTNLITGTWVDLPAAVPPISLNATNRTDYFRLKWE